jgi:hypothetical protein
MALNLALFVVGLVLAGMALRDVFDTVVIPGDSRASLRVARRLGAVLLPIWKKIRGRRRGISGSFAPVVLFGSFVIWLALLGLAFGLMAYASRADFQPRLESLPEAIYTVGSSMTTVGPGKAETVTGVARWILLGAGFCGLAVMTMAVTYLLQVQSSIGRRDTGIIKLNTSAGEPPSALTMLERFAALRNQKAVGDVLANGRDWCATVRQSHCSHPTLIYFQSIGVGSGWPAALGAILDLALFAEHCIDDDSFYGPAILLRNEGLRMARDLAGVAGLKPCETAANEAELKQATNRLATSGYPLRKEIRFGEMAAQRAQYRAFVDALAAHLGKPGAVLVRQD